MPAKPKPAPAPWRSRIVGYGEESPGALLANPFNFRTHNAAQKQAMGGVLREVGVVQNVLVNKTTGHIIDGHLRTAMAITEGQPKVPITYVELSEEEEKLILATFDPISAMAGTDQKKLLELVSNLSVGDDALRALLGLCGPAGLTDPDAVPEVPAEPVSALGDLWLLGRNRLLCGDATSIDAVERLMDGEKADMVFTDPPYGVNYTGGAKKRAPIPNDHVGTGIYAEALPLLVIAAADHAALYLWYADAHAAAAAAAAAGYIITAQIIWVKNNAQFVSSAHYHGKHEPCFYAHRKGKSAAWFGENNEVTVWDVDRANKNEFHPTQKPVALASRALRNSSQVGDMVLDLFGGSGSTLIAAEESGRAARLMEIETQYVDVTITRWQNFTGQEAKLEDGRTFREVAHERTMVAA